jgi:hypothetical protein
VNIFPFSSLCSLCSNGKGLGHEIVVGDQDCDEADGEEVLLLGFWGGVEREEKRRKRKRLSFLFFEKRRKKTNGRRNKTRASSRVLAWKTSSGDNFDCEKE